MATIDTDRFVRLPGSARRYYDLETGETVSRRTAITQSIGMAPEQLAELRREVGAAQESRSRAFDSEMARLGVPVRGPKAAEWREVKAELERSMSLRTRDPRGGNWVSIIEKRFGKEIVNSIDWDRIFYPGGKD